MTAPHAPFRWQVRVYYEDTDFSGLVYHARHLQFFERGRTEALRACGVNHSDLLNRDPPLAFAVRRMEIDWRAPARIDDILTIETDFATVRGARMTLAQRILREDTEIATAHVEAACIGLDGRPRRLPPDVAAALLPDA